MDTVDITHAKEHLEELTERAKRGEEVSFGVPGQGTFKISYVGADVAAPRRPVLGQWKGKLTVPQRLFEPLNNDELVWLSGATSL
ncbi:MAG: hypothetical protein ABL894_13645 [Hyphomicrobium sp.]